MFIGSQCMRILALVVFAAFGIANAGTAIQSFTDPVVWPNSDNQDWSLGWEFAVTGSVTIDALGYNYFGEPLNSAHQVGIYDASSETLLASATVNNGSTLIDGYLYTSLGSPVVLSSGDYWIVGTTLGLDDGWIYQADSIVTDPSIAYLTSGFSDGAGGVLSFPVTGASGRQYIEVNFEMPGASVPEPGTLALFGVGLLGVVTASRRRWVK